MKVELEWKGSKNKCLKIKKMEFSTTKGFWNNQNNNIKYSKYNCNIQDQIPKEIKYLYLNKKNTVPIESLFSRDIKYHKNLILIYRPILILFSNNKVTLPAKPLMHWWSKIMEFQAQLQSFSFKNFIKIKVILFSEIKYQKFLKVTDQVIVHRD